MAPEVYSEQSDNCLRYDKLPTTLAQVSPTLPQTAQYVKLPTTLARFAPTLPQTAQYAIQTTYNTGSGLSHFTSDCTVRQTNYLQHWLRSLPLYLRLHSTPVTKNVPCYSNHGLFRRRHPRNISLRPSFSAL